MIRINLLPAPGDGIALLGVSIDRRFVRDILLGALLAMLAGATTFSFQHVILERTRTAANRDEKIVARHALERDAANALGADVARLQRVEREALARRRSGNTIAVALARIGNAIPWNVWLDGIDQRPDGYLVAGDAPSLDAIGETLLSVERDDRGHRVALLGLTRDERTETIHFSLQLTPVEPVPFSVSPTRVNTP